MYPQQQQAIAGASGGTTATQDDDDGLGALPDGKKLLFFKSITNNLTIILKLILT